MEDFEHIKTQDGYDILLSVFNHISYMVDVEVVNKPNEEVNSGNSTHTVIEGRDLYEVLKSDAPHMEVAEVKRMFDLN
jgi:hypothetical protein